MLMVINHLASSSVPCAKQSIKLNETVLSLRAFCLVPCESNKIQKNTPVLREFHLKYICQYKLKETNSTLKVYALFVLK